MIFLVQCQVYKTVSFDLKRSTFLLIIKFESFQLITAFQTVCDADQHACIQKGGTSLVMSSEQSTTSTYYDLCTGSPQYVDGEEIPQVEVRDRQKQLICVIQPGVYVVNGKNLKALDLRKYTMGNFVLKAKTPCDTAILTYYSGFQMDSDNTLDNFY